MTSNTTNPSPSALGSGAIEAVPVSPQPANLTVTNSTFSGNTARHGGAILLSNTGTTALSAEIDHSTFTGNTATIAGGALYDTAAVGSPFTLTITDSTISGNQAAGDGGGVVIGNGNSSPDTLVNDTIAGNSVTGVSGQGGDVYVGSTAPVFTNTIVAGGSASAGADCFGTVTSHGHNIDDGNNCGFNAPGDQQNTNPKLGPLQDNGGPTQTRALLPGSPAIDAGTSVGCPATDQRDVARPQGAACDIGAYEYAPPSVNSARATAGSTSATVTASVSIQTRRAAQQRSTMGRARLMDRAREACRCRRSAAPS